MAKKTNPGLIAVAVIVALVGAVSVQAEPVVPPGYYVEPYVTNLTNVSDIAFSPGGDFGYDGQLFILDSRPNAKIYRAPQKGEKIFFADVPNSRVMSTSLDFPPIESEFGPYLFVSIEHHLYKYASNGTRQHFADITVFPWDIKFAPDERFRNDLFQTDGWEPSREAVREWKPDATQSVLVYTDREETCGLAFAPAGGFGEDLYIAFVYSERSGYPYSAISRVTPDGLLTEWCVAQEFGYANQLAFDTTGNFRGNLFVSDYKYDVVWEIDPDGNISEFAGGFAFSAYSDYAPLISSSIAFGPDGAMYVSDGGDQTVWRIVPTSRELDRLEITGPDEILGACQTQYTATAMYDDGSTMDVTTRTLWSVEPNDIIGMAQGLLTTDIIDLPITITITAQYSEGDIEKSAEKHVSIFPMCPGGAALQFDGVDDYVNVPDSISLRLPSTLTVEAWVKPIHDDGDYYADAIICKGQNVGWGPYFNYRIAMENDNLYTWGVTRQGAELYFHGGTPVYDNWQYLAVVADGTRCTAYVNGNEVASRDAPGPYLTFEGYPLQIGGHAITNARWFSGLIDEVRIWNSAKTADEIRVNMYRKSFIGEPNLVGYWNFDEGEGDIAHDSSGLGNDGTVVGAVWTDSIPPVGDICTLDALVQRNLNDILTRKLAIIDELAALLDKEAALLDYMDQAFHTGQLDNLSKGDVVKAKEKIHSAMQHEQQAQTSVGRSVDKLDDAMSTLGIK